MLELIEISQTQAIKLMDDNLRIIKECYNSDTFLLLSNNLGKGVPTKNKRINRKEGMQIIGCCKTFIFNKDSGVDKVSVLSMYTELQNDIYNILPIGIQYDIPIVPREV